LHPKANHSFELIYLKKEAIYKIKQDVQTVYVWEAARLKEVYGPRFWVWKL